MAFIHISLIDWLIAGAAKAQPALPATMKAARPHNPFEEEAMLEEQEEMEERKRAAADRQAILADARG